MKTLIVLNEVIYPLQFLLIEGDYSRFHGVCVNSSDGNGHEEEFVEFIYDSLTGEKKHGSEWTLDKEVLEGKKWDKIAIATFLP